MTVNKKYILNTLFCGSYSLAKFSDNVIWTDAYQG